MRNWGKRIPRDFGVKMIKRFSSILCIDSHTGGEPTRTVISGLPEIKGATISEKSDFFKNKLDEYRSVLILEPRAHKQMIAVVLCQPCTPKGDFGLVIMCALGYIGMCGHGLIGAVTSVLEAGIVKPVEPITELKVETPAGIISVEAEYKNGKVGGVTFKNVPSFIYAEDVQIDTPSFGSMQVDVAYSGCWYVVVNAEKHGLELNKDKLSIIGEANNEILSAVNKIVKPVHPELGKLDKLIDQVAFYGPPKREDADTMNLITSEALGYDRCPCGTGSSAKMAVLHKKGILKTGESYTHESCITGSIFKSRVIEEVQLDSINGIIPEITGFAYLSSINNIVMDERDELRFGFKVD
jgi:proline racemase